MREIICFDECSRFTEEDFRKLLKRARDRNALVSWGYRYQEEPLYNNDGKRVDTLKLVRLEKDFRAGNIKIFSPSNQNLTLEEKSTLQLYLQELHNF